MRTRSLGPLPVSTLIWQPRAGTFALTVVCKGVFVLQSGVSPLADEQAAPFGADVYWEDDPRRSLRVPNDLVPFKRYAEVFFTGHAYAAHGQPTTSLVASVSLGEWRKAIEVHGDRYWASDGRLSATAPFVAMPLRWERASGGPGTWNPVGLVPNGPVDAHGLLRVPNFLPVGLSLRSIEDPIPPIGFGPLAPVWPERLTKLRQYARLWRHEGWMHEPLPDDIDAAYFNAASPDQLLTQLPLGERLVLEFLHPEVPKLATTLETVNVRAMVQRESAAGQDVRLRCDTMWIDTDSATCTLVWRGVVPLQHPGERGTITIVSTQPQKEEDEAGGTVIAPAKPKGGRIKATMPFKMVPADGAAMPPVVVREIPVSVPPTRDDAGLTGMIAPGFVPATSLPFVEANKGVWTPAPALPNERDIRFSAPDVGDATVTLVPHDASFAAAILPFAATHANTPVETIAQHIEDEPIGLSEAVKLVEEPAQPAMLGPLATPEMVQAEIAAAEETKKPEPQEEKLPIDEYPIDRCGGIAARMARGKEDRYAILKAENLKEKVWQKLHAHWQAEIKAEAGRGENALMLAYDRGYVSALERERGPITTEEFRRLVLAVERGKGEETLAAMGLPRGAMMRIRRVRMNGEVVAKVWGGRSVLPKYLD